MSGISTNTCAASDDNLNDDARYILPEIQIEERFRKSSWFGIVS